MSKRILVVEDDLDGQHMMKAILQHLNFLVDIADDGEQATSLLLNGSENYDVVIIDLALPGIDGWQLLDKILSTPNIANLPCIALTAFHSSIIKHEVFRAGFRAYLTKPLQQSLLELELANLLS